MNDVHVFGADYKQVPLDKLENICVTRETAKDLLRDCSTHSVIEEISLLSTCNRMELYFVSKSPEQARSFLAQVLEDHGAMNKEYLIDTLYLKSEDEAVSHLFQVSAGLRSMIYGEQEILGQVKQGYTWAQGQGYTGPYLNKLFQTAIAVGKRVRDETSLSDGAYSISSISVDMLRAKNPDCMNQAILIVGAGDIARRSIRKWVSIGHTQLSVSNRSAKGAQALAEEFGIAYLPYEKLPMAYSNFSVISFATAADHFLLRASDHYRLSPRSWIIDLGMPRNVDPALSAKGHELLSLVDFQSVVTQTFEQRQADEAQIRATLAETLEQLHQWQSYRNSLSAEPVIAKTR